MSLEQDALSAGITQPLEGYKESDSANGFADDIIIQQPACVCDDNRQDLDGSNYIRKSIWKYSYSMD